MKPIQVAAKLVKIRDELIVCNATPNPDLSFLIEDLNKLIDTLSGK